MVLKKFLNLLIIFILIFTGRLKTYSQIGGTSIYSFLNLPSSANQVSFGGYNNSLNEISLVYENMSLLSDSMLNFFTLSYNNYFSGIYYINFGYCTRFFRNNRVLIGKKFINYGEFIRTDEIGREIGKFYANDFLMYLGSSIKIDTFPIYFGICIKPILSVYESYKSFGLAFDLSFTYFDKKGMNFSLVSRNIGMQIKSYTENKEPLTYAIDLLVSKKLENSPFTLQLSLIELQNFKMSEYKRKGNEQDVNKVEQIGEELLYHLVCGASIKLIKSFYINFGYNFKRRKELVTEGKKGLTGFSYGFNLITDNFQISFGRSQYFVGQSISMVTLNLNCERIYKKFILNEDNSVFIWKNKK